MIKSIQTAVILAAGAGRRLQNVAGELPKGLLKIGDRSMMDRSVDLLLKHSIERVIVVVGYQASKYFEALTMKRPSIDFVLNPYFQQTGSMHSLFRARTRLREDFLLLESDLIYEPRALASLLNSKKNDVILVSGRTGAGDEVYVYGHEGTVSAISKKRLSSFTAQGELVGISKISHGLYQEMCRFYEKHIPKFSNYDYEDCLSDMSKDRVINYLKINDLVWAEIDDKIHYQRAIERVYPQIMRIEGRSGPFR